MTGRHAPDARRISAGAPRRVAVIDFDWSETDLLPALLGRPGIRVALVAGTGARDPGLRAAGLFGLRRTDELADLTREIFDLAMIGERSPRRSEIERLLGALGTEVVSPRSFAAVPGSAPEGSRPATRDPGRDHDDHLAELLASAIPDLAPADPEPEARGHRFATADEPPSPHDRPGLARALAMWAADSGAHRVTLDARGGGRVDRLAAHGATDPLLERLADLALEHGEPAVVSRLTGSRAGRLWGAWPLRVGDRPGVLAAAGFDPEDRMEWERRAAALQRAWEAGSDSAWP